MSDLATVTDLGTQRGKRRLQHHSARRTRTPWAGPSLPVTWMDGTDVLPGGGYSFGDNSSRSQR